MKNPLILSLIALLVGVAALVSSLLARAPRGPRGAAVADGVAFEPNGSLGLRIEALRVENRVLRERLSALELSHVSPAASRAPAPAGVVSREEFEAFRDEVHAALRQTGTLSAKLSSEPDAFKNQVANTLSEIRREETIDKVRAWEDAKLERLGETLAKAETWLGLTPGQSTQMRTALLARYEREAELTRRWEAGEDPEVLGEIKASDRAIHLTELSGILTPAQLATYSARGQGGK